MSTNFKGAIIGGIYPDNIGLDYFSYYSCPKLDQYDFIVFHPDLISDLPDDGVQVENDNWIAEPFNFLNINARNLFWQTTLLELLARGSNVFYVLDPFFHIEKRKDSETLSNHLDFDGVRLTTYTNKDTSNYLHEADLFDSLFCHIKPYITPRCEIIPLGHEQIQFPVRSISSNIVAGVYSPETAFGSLCLLPNIDIIIEGTPYYDELFDDDGTLSEAPPKETIKFYNRYFSLLNEISAKLRYE